MRRSDVLAEGSASRRPSTSWASTSSAAVALGQVPRQEEIPARSHAHEAQIYQDGRSARETQRRQRRYKKRVCMPSMRDPHVATIEGWLAAEPQLTVLAIASWGAARLGQSGRDPPASPQAACGRTRNGRPTVGKVGRPNSDMPVVGHEPRARRADGACRGGSQPATQGNARGCATTASSDEPLSIH